MFDPSRIFERHPLMMLEVMHEVWRRICVITDLIQNVVKGIALVKHLFDDRISEALMGNGRYEFKRHRVIQINMTIAPITSAMRK